MKRHGKMKLEFPEALTPQEEMAIEILRNAKVETDEDYRALAQLIADEVIKIETEQ